MAHTVTIQTELEAERHVIVRVYVKGDGSSPDLSGVTIVDPTQLLNPLPAKPVFTIEEIWFDLDGFGVRLDFDDLEDHPAWTLSKQSSDYICFVSMGGIVDRSGLDGTGKLLLSTIGLDTATKQGSLLIKLRK